MKNEFCDIAFRKKIYHSLDELQIDVNEWLKTYNEIRSHSGRFCYGETPMRTFIESRKLAEEKMLDKCHHLKDNTLEPTTATE